MKAVPDISRMGQFPWNFMSRRLTEILGFQPSFYFTAGRKLELDSTFT